jgi:flagellar secretion chaperone FliS
MKPRSSAAAYGASRIENAPPLELVRLMYEGALRFLDQAQSARDAAQAARFQERCLRAQSVVAELRLALDPAQAPELARDLAELYLFAEGEIRRAMAESSPEPLAPVREVLATLLDGWRRLEIES